MSEFNQEILTLLPAVRMTLSTESLLSCKIILPEEMPGNIDQHKLSRLDNLKKLTGASVESIIDEINAEAAKTPNYLYSEKYGLICCAGTKSEVDSLYMNGLKILNGEQKEPFSVKKTSGRIRNKIAIITGAAQGFGKGIAKDLFEEGANIIIADLNEEAGIALRNELNETDTPNRAFFVKMDVSNPESVENTIFETVREFGGLDIMISNAGVLRAGGLDEMNASTFKFMTDINYTGYFYCAKYASAVMKIQNNYNPEYFYDILQINSKSGLSGSKKNFAYAGGKFGGIGLTQSFALELIPNNIKVNSICPGNFFEGPLWADPDKGLFVQYLNAGKVPGAKTIADVQKFYEAQVPSGRGCRIKDVSRAILYAIEQEYETGQAIPVTGGQVMLN